MALLDICTNSLERSTILELPAKVDGVITEIVIDSLSEVVMELKPPEGTQSGPTYYAY